MQKDYGGHITYCIYIHVAMPALFPFLIVRERLIVLLLGITFVSVKFMTNVKFVQDIYVFSLLLNPLGFHSTQFYNFTSGWLIFDGKHTLGWSNIYVKHNWRVHLFFHTVCTLHYHQYKIGGFSTKPLLLK